MRGSYEEQQREAEVDYLFEKLNNIDKALQNRLSRRELFAAMAMQGFCAGSEITDTYAHIAEFAVKQADALITQLNASKGEG